MRRLDVICTTTLLLGLGCGGQQPHSLPFRDGSAHEARLPDLAVADGPLREADGNATDGAVLDASLPDTSGWDTERGPVCDEAIPVVLVDGKATLTGDTSGASNSVSLVPCITAPTPGPDRFFELIATKTTTYRATLTADHYAALFVSLSCSDPASTCVAGSVRQAANTPQAVSFVVQSGATYYLGIDSTQAAGAYSSVGAFTLTVEEVPDNDLCPAATPLTFVNGVATVKGDTSLATDNVNLPYSSSCLQKPTPGPDLFYAFPATAGKGYRVYLMSSHDASLYVFGDCASPASSCLAAVDDRGPSEAEDVMVLANASSILYVGVDSDEGSGKGDFTLYVEEVTQPANDQCTGALPIVPSGPAGPPTGDVCGDVFLATDTVNLPTTACTGASTPGADLFYSFTATAGKLYRLKLWAGFNSALYVFTDCASPASTCLAGGAKANRDETEELVFVAKSSGMHYVGVDGHDPQQSYNFPTSFVLSLEELDGVAAANASCASPEPLTWSGSNITLTVDGRGWPNDLSGIRCGGSYDFDGPQLYYRVPLAAGKKYVVGASDFPSYAGVYAFPSSTPCSPLFINAACFFTYIRRSDNWIANYFTIRPAVSEDWIVAVDSYAEATYGPFTVTIDEEPPAPANDLSTGAQLLTFPDGVNWMYVSDGTFAANNDVDLGYSGRTGRSTPGPDLFYKMELNPPYSYTITLVSEFEGALYLFTDAGDPAGSCVAAGADGESYGWAERIIHFTPSVAGLYFIGVDGSYALDDGMFNLSVSRE